MQTAFLVSCQSSDLLYPKNNVIKNSSFSIRSLLKSSITPLGFYILPQLSLTRPFLSSSLSVSSCITAGLPASRPEYQHLRLLPCPHLHWHCPPLLSSLSSSVSCVYWAHLHLISEPFSFVLSVLVFPRFFPLVTHVLSLCDLVLFHDSNYWWWECFGVPFPRVL